MRSRRTPARGPVAVTGSGPLADGLRARLAERGDRPVVAGPAGAATVVHLDASRDPSEPAARRAARTVGGTRALLAAAREAGVRRVVLVTSADVYAARPGQLPVPERAPIRSAAEGTLVGDWVEVERQADHARRTGLDVVVLRPSALVGAGVAPTGLLRSLSAPRLLAVRGVEPLWQVCHVDDLVAALEVAATGGLRRAAAVTAEGWLPQSRVEELAGRRRLELPASVALSTAERLHRLGVMTASPDELDVLVAPVVVEAVRLRAAGWRPRWTHEEALRAHVATLPPHERGGGYAAGAAGATVALVGTAAVVRRARRRRRGR